MAKQKSFENFLDEIREKWGDVVVSEIEEVGEEEIKVIPTGIVSFDISTGVGGIPAGSQSLPEIGRSHTSRCADGGAARNR